MTAIAATYFGRTSVLRPSSTAAGTTAERLAKILLNAVTHARENATDWRPFTNALIEELALAHSQPNWDGYGASPIAPEAKSFAQAIIDQLPSTIPAPDPTADPEGDLALTWDFAPGHVFTLSIDRDGMLSYAGLLGQGRKKHGMEPFEGIVPAVVVESVQSLCDRIGHR